LGKLIWISLIAIIIVGSSTLFFLYTDKNLSASQKFDSLYNFSASDTMTIGPHYLSRPPYFPNNNYNITKIFLESATLTYDYSNISFTSDSGDEAFRGVHAIIINATVRNDYTVEEIIQFSQEGISNCLFGIDVYMYDEYGDIVPTRQRGNPFRGSYELGLKSGETISVNMVFATTNRNINYFEIYVSYLPNVPL